jgi:hypothetical protein
MPDLSRAVASTCIAASYSMRLRHRTLTSASNGRERESNQWAEFMDELIEPNSGPNPARHRGLWSSWPSDAWLRGAIMQEGEATRHRKRQAAIA